MTERQPGRLLLLGGGYEPFREYALRSIAARAPVALLSAVPVTWELPYVVASEVVDLDDRHVVAEAARRMRADGVLTYDERYVELAATLAGDLGLPYTDAGAITTCRDKPRLRRVLQQHGLSPVRFGAAHELSEAVRLADEVGYPLVVKPRALGGSIGVVRVDGPQQLASAFEQAADARIGAVRSSYAGVLLEECLEGPEYSVDCVTVGGHTTPVVTAEKIVDFHPYYEEVGHHVPAPSSPELAEAIELVVAVHRAVGLDRIVTHSEFRLTAAGPRIIEVNVRLGGDLIPQLGYLASGVDLAAACADVALGRVPDLVPRRSAAAAVRFFYPVGDLQVEHVGLDAPQQAFAGLERFETLVSPGDKLLLPPRGFLSRAALAVVTGADRRECEARLAAVGASVVCEGRALGPVEGAAPE